MSAASSENLLGALGSPRFEPVRVVGEGGSGIVYEVRLRSGLDTKRNVALKVLRAELAPSERERRRFLEEADRMQRLHAKGVVELLEAGLLPDGRPYLAMPLLEGETLAARLTRGAVPAATALRWFEILARAVQTLHDAGMVHRDVKPENIFIEGDAPVLLDFGIARDLDDDTTTTTAEGRVRGTPAYMAPERFFGAAASIQSDVYELGVVLYTMLVGRLPWGSEKNVTERLNPISPRDVGADVSNALATVILRALSTRPEKRPTSAAELAREVASAARDASGPARHTADLAIEHALRENDLGERVTEALPASASPPELARTEIADVAEIPRSPKVAAAMEQVPARGTRSGRGLFLVGLGLALGVLGVIGTRALTPPVPPPAPSMLAAPVACAVTTAPTALPTASASATVPSSVFASASARPPGSAVPAPRPVTHPPVTSASAKPSVGPSSAPPSVAGSARWFEDRQ